MATRDTRELCIIHNRTETLDMLQETAFLSLPTNITLRHSHGIVMHRHDGRFGLSALRPPDTFVYAYINQTGAAIDLSYQSYHV